ncbi:hypothetical protein FM120_21140 [Sphingobacterium faecium PCAi_F2.5]|nr:hypothetical protein FM120_21140 [Sphingobacterium faecium PCAi_F2.5]
MYLFFTKKLNFQDWKRIYGYFLLPIKIYNFKIANKNLN